jgi:hypothetical protein
MNLALSVAAAITLPRRSRSPALSGTAFVCASPTLTLAIFLCVARSTCTTVGPPLVSTPPEAANRVAGTKTYDERETVTGGPR